MPDYDNKMSGIAFKNDRKTEDKHPDYTGTFTDHNNVERYLDIRIKVGKGDKKFLTIKVGKEKNSSRGEGRTPGNGRPARATTIHHSKP